MFEGLLKVTVNKPSRSGLVADSGESLWITPSFLFRDVFQIIQNGHKGFQKFDLIFRLPRSILLAVCRGYSINTLRSNVGNYVFGV